MFNVNDGSTVYDMKGVIRWLTYTRKEDGGQKATLLHTEYQGRPQTRDNGKYWVFLYFIYVGLCLQYKTLRLPSPFRDCLQARRAFIGHSVPLCLFKEKMLKEALR